MTRRSRDRMSPTKLEATRVDYPKQWFVLGTIAYAFATVAIVYLGLTAKEDFGRAFWFGFAAIEGVLLFLFLVPSLLTSHLAGEKALRLRMGVLLDATVPYGWIKGVRETSIPRGGLRVGIGVRYSPIPKMLFVTSSFGGLVVLELDGEHVMGRLLKRPVETIIMNVTNSPGFISSVRERAGKKE